MSALNKHLKPRINSCYMKFWDLNDFQKQIEHETKHKGATLSRKSLTMLKSVTYTVGIKDFLQEFL